MACLHFRLRQGSPLLCVLFCFSCLNCSAVYFKFKKWKLQHVLQKIIMYCFTFCAGPTRKYQQFSELWESFLSCPGPAPVTRCLPELSVQIKTSSSSRLNFINALLLPRSCKCYIKLSMFLWHVQC